MKTLVGIAVLLLSASIASADSITTWDFSGTAPGYTFSGTLTADYAPEVNAAPYAFVTAVLGGEINGQPITPQSFTPPLGGQFCAGIDTLIDCQGAAFGFRAGGTSYEIWWNDTDAPNSGLNFTTGLINDWTWTAVPEPSAALLVLVGLAFVALLSRSRMRRYGA